MSESDQPAGVSVDGGRRPLPQPAAWVAQLGGDGRYPQIAKVREAYPEDNALDLVFYSGSGERVGRLSPAMGGPKGFEPFCGADTWVEIEAPPFEEMAAARWGWRDLLKPVRPASEAAHLAAAQEVEDEPERPAGSSRG